MALSKAQAFALIMETDSALNLMKYGTRVVREAAFAVNAYDAILTTLSIGVEKTLKLSLGLHDLDTSGSWTSFKKMKDDYRHDIVGMWDLLKTRLGGATATIQSPYSSWMLREVVNDPVIVPTFAALDMYGKSGRFFNLDQLGQFVQQGQNPLTAWQEAEQVALEHSVRVQTEAAGDSATDELRARFWLDIDAREVIANSLDRWWLAVAVCGLHGALGQRGRQFGTAMRDSRPLPDMVP